MDTNNLNEKALRKFLLGNMSQKKQEAAELWLMCNEEACSQLEAAEDDLIDDFLAGKLNARDSQQFMTHFLASPEREEKLQFGSTLKRYIERVDPKTEPAAKPIPIRQKTAALFSNRLANSYAMAAMFAIFLIGAPLSYIKITDLKHELNATNFQLAYLQDTDRELSQLKSQYQLLTQLATDLTPGPPIRLNKGLSRSSNNIPDVPVTPLTKFSLSPMVDYDEYNVVLFDAAGKELWAVEGLQAKISPEGQTVDLGIPGILFETGEYYLSLAGISGSQPPENINDYPFHAVVR